MADVSSPRTEPAEPARSDAGPVNVLLVDDRPENLDALEAVLANEHIRLVKATSGDEALARLSQERFALILMDVHLPGLDGIETVAQIKQQARSRHIPIILMTAVSLDDSNMRKGYAVGAVDYIHEPFEPDVLRTKVSVFVDLYQQQERIVRQAAENERLQTLRIEELQAALQQEAVIEKLRAVDRLKTNFLNAASHELRTPLTAIIGYAELLEDGVGGRLTPDQRDFVQQIQAGGRQLKTLVDDLLDFARLEAGNLERADEIVDFTEVLTEAFTVLRPLAEDGGIEMCVAGPEAPVWVAMARNRLEQVLHNLVGNALKFTPAGGKVTVEARQVGEDLVAEVHDTGIGIAAEHLPNLFGRFYQVDPSSTRAQGGTGLGLSICKALVEANGGSIGALSEPGRGSTFWFTLPAQAGPEAAAPAA